MRIKLIFLLLILVICTLSYDSVKSNNKDKAAAYNKAKQEKVKKAELKKDEEDGVETLDLKDLEDKAGVQDDEEGEEDEEDEPPKKKVPKKVPKKEKKPEKKEKPTKSRKGKKNDPEITEEVKEENDDEDEENEYQACNFETAGEDELCHCDMEEINCSSVVMDSDDPHLTTADLLIMKKDFKPFYANFSENAIRRLQKGKVLPGFEKHVQTFDVSYNQIRYIDSDVFKPFTNLSKLDLSHNNLQTIKKPVFDVMKDTLHRLDLGYNRIKALPDDIFDGLVNLKVLSLDGNPIKVWKKEIFKGLDNLEKLSMDGCSIDELPADIFEYLPKLTTLSLRENPMDEIPTAVANTKTLKGVDMSVTNLTEIRNHAFKGDADLEEINLEKMPFLSVVRDCGFCGLSKLKVLLLNDNSKLMEVHPNAFGFINSDPGHKASAITSLDLHNANLTIISEHMIDYDKLQSFKIGENPWRCNCDTQFLMEEKFSFKADSISPVCGFPVQLKGRHLETLKITDACEDARFLGRSGRFSSVLGLALLAGFVAIGSYYMVSSGKLATLIRKVRKEPEVSYTNLQANGAEDFALESDFQPRPAEV